ncbi:hypothetical protein [Nocardiopsis sp. NPDC057823]|uniref:hypothetical protein n=1 Tax=Nocardiopsis sp. NPDC057823 TaxID=3346256 RepID=UPI00366C29AB
MSSVKEQMFATVVFWPLVLPARAINGGLERAVTEGDPREQAKRLREQKAYIRKLERDLGIGD